MCPTKNGLIYDLVLQVKCIIEQDIFHNITKGQTIHLMVILSFPAVYTDRIAKEEIISSGAAYHTVKLFSLKCRQDGLFLHFE